MTDDLDVVSRLMDYHDHIAPPTVPVAHDVRRGRRRVARRRTLAAGGVALVVAGVVLTASLVTRNDPGGPPVPAPSPSEKRSTAIDPVLSTRPSEVLAAQQVGRYRLEVGGELLPGSWLLQDSRRDVWVAPYRDEVGYVSPALWWGKGTTTHEVPGPFGGVAISQDAHWIVWTRGASDTYQPAPTPRVMEVVDTATGKVRWSRNADADAADIGALAVTNDGVVLFAHCNRVVPDPGGWPACHDVRLDVWSPKSGVTRTVPTEQTDVLVTGAHNGFLVSDAARGRWPSARPQYLRVSESGDVEVVATLPRKTVAVTADERFALLCADRHHLCAGSVLSLDGGESRPIPSLAKFAPITDYEWQINPYVVERADLLVVRTEGLYGRAPAVARCSLAQARCVRIEE
jgi:hypothetical protein